MPLDTTAPKRWAAQIGPQQRAIDAYWVPELLFGGARGGGKSDFLLGDWLQDAHLGSVWRGVLFRQSFPELEELIARSQTMIPQCAPGAEWFKQEKTWRLPRGAELRMRSLEAPEDAAHYQGHQYSWIGWDELAAWKDSKAYQMLFACLRSAEDVPHKRVRASANPGGVGHAWVKARFIDPAPGGYELIIDPATGIERMFIPSRLADNLILMQRDPHYIDRLHGVGSPELVKAWLEGDWSAVVGSYFPEFSMQRHVVRPFEVPAGWLRFRAMDWGSARPFCVLWCAISDGSARWLPAGSLVVYREWYGASEPNVGLRLPAEDVATGIRERELGDEPVAYSVADPAIFASDGGPSIAERFGNKRIMFRPADNKRTGKLGASGGWDLIRHRLVGEDGNPMLYIFNTCTALIRTLPALQHDAAKPEDVDTRGDDHACFVGETIINGKRIDTIGCLTRCDTQTILVRFEDGFSVECTPDHRFLTETGEWVRADRLQGKFIYSALPARSSLGSAIISAAFTFSAKAVDCIAQYGSTITAKFRAAITFITLMMTAATTELETWPSCQAPGTSLITALSDLRLQQQQKRWQQPQSGTGAKKDDSGTEPTHTIPLPSWQPGWLRWFARCVGNLSRHRLTSLLGPNSVTSTAERVRCVSVEPQSELKDVYCLAADGGWLQLANGVIASNCDTLRYACASRPWVRAPAPRAEGLTINRLWELREQGSQSLGWRWSQ